MSHNIITLHPLGAFDIHEWNIPVQLHVDDTVRQNQSKKSIRDFCWSYSGDSLLYALIIVAQIGGLWERNASGVPPVRVAVTAPCGGGVRPLEKLLPQCIISVGGGTRAHARPEALHSLWLPLDGRPTAFLFSVNQRVVSNHAKLD